MGARAVRVGAVSDRRNTYQGRSAVRALAHTAYSLGCAALGDMRGAAAHAAAASAWGALAVYVAGAVRLGMPQWLADAMWIEPPPIGVSDSDDEATN